MTSEYFEMVSPTYIENWPPDLTRLSIAQVDIPLTREETVVLGCTMPELGETFLKYLTLNSTPDQVRSVSANIQERIHLALQKFPRGGFIRLGSRSPKDSFLAYHYQYQPVDARMAFSFLLDSERIFEDLHLALVNNYNVHIWIREQLQIAPWAEFRCFVSNGKILGISQYNYLHKEYFTDLEYHSANLAFYIPKYLHEEVIPSLHLPQVVVDVFVKVRKEPGTFANWVTEVKLLEINPFCEWTDPCLFGWPELNRAEVSQFRFYNKDQQLCKKDL